MCCLTKPLQVFQKLLSCRTNQILASNIKIAFIDDTAFPNEGATGILQSLSGWTLLGCRLLLNPVGFYKSKHQSAMAPPSQHFSYWFLQIFNICAHKMHSPFTPDWQDSCLKVCSSIKLTMKKSKISDMVFRSSMFISSKTVGLDCIQSLGFLLLLCHKMQTTVALAFKALMQSVDKNFS